MPNEYFANPSYSALLSLDNGQSTGSGFRVKYKNLFFLVTAKHVLYKKDDITNLFILRCALLAMSFQDLKGGEQNSEIIEIDMTTAHIIVSEEDDIAVVLLGRGEGTPTFEDYVTPIRPGSFASTYLNFEECRLLNQIEIASTVHLVGYATSLQFQDMGNARPLLRKGIVAGFDIKANVFIIDCPAYYGTSGSPIFSTDDEGNLQLIGLAARYVPLVVEWKNPRELTLVNTEYVNSGYCICIPFDKIVATIEAFHQNA